MNVANSPVRNILTGIADLMAWNRARPAILRPNPRQKRRQTRHKARQRRFQRRKVPKCHRTQPRRPYRPNPCRNRRRFMPDNRQAWPVARPRPLTTSN